MCCSVVRRSPRKVYFQDSFGLFVVVWFFFFKYLKNREASWATGWSRLLFNHLPSRADLGRYIKTTIFPHQAPPWHRKHSGIEKTSSLSLKLKP